MAFEYGKQNGLDVVAVDPGYVFGPVMQPILNFSTLLLLKFVQGIYIEKPQGNYVRIETITRISYSFPQFCGHWAEIFMHMGNRGEKSSCLIYIHFAKGYI